MTGRWSRSACGAGLVCLLVGCSSIPVTPLRGQDGNTVSIPGVTPAAKVSWFQALAAARNSGKRLPTNAEWQAAALGTPDGAPCRVTSAPGGPLLTGTPGCVSDVGAFDMVGNVWEWVAEWVPISTACPGWLLDGVGFKSDDTNCLARTFNYTVLPDGAIRFDGRADGFSPVQECLRAKYGYRF
jgi:Sulfatase-modifying factor enzyme 1